MIICYKQSNLLDTHIIQYDVGGYILTRNRVTKVRPKKHIVILTDFPNAMNKCWTKFPFIKTLSIDKIKSRRAAGKFV